MDTFYVHDKVRNNWLMIKKEEESGVWYVYYHFCLPVKKRFQPLSPVETAVQIALGIFPASFSSNIYGTMYLTNNDQMEIWVEK